MLFLNSISILNILIFVTLVTGIPTLSPPADLEIPAKNIVNTDDTNITGLTFLTDEEFKQSGLKVPEAQSWRRCETSGGSPYIGDLYAVVAKLYGRGGYCCNTSIRRNECTNIEHSGSADVGFCGEQRCVTCANMAGEVWQLIGQCASNGRAGGVVFYDPTSYIVVY